MKKIILNTIEEALKDIKSGKMIIVVDSEDRENEGDLVMAAEMVTPEAINFMCTKARGLICTPITKEMALHLELPLQTADNTALLGTAFTVSVDARDGISTGISSYDRSLSIQRLINPQTKPMDLVRPGHIFPLIAKDGGVLTRPGHTEASVDLARMAGLKPAGIICEIMNDDGSMARLPELYELAQKLNLKIISIEDLILYRKINECLIEESETIDFANKYGDFKLSIFKSPYFEQEAVAIYKLPLEENLLVRVHSECFTGDIFGSLRCDCGEQLAKSFEHINHENSGMVIYLKQEGRGIGLFNKIKAYKLQDQGLDTVEANLKLHLPVDSREYSFAAQILRYFNLTQIRLMTNNPLKIESLEKLGITISKTITLETKSHAKNAPYLLTKKQKLGHKLNLDTNIH